MNLTDHEVLAHIEQHVANDLEGPDEIDARIAAELGVPVDYYFAYLLVWGAIECYRERILPQQGLAMPADSGPLQCAQNLAEEIGWTATTIYQETVGNGHGDVNAAAGRLIAAAMQLSGCLDQLGVDGDDDQVTVEVSVDAG
jgi:hypothetical protein